MDEADEAASGPASDGDEGYGRHIPTSAGLIRFVGVTHHLWCDLLRGVRLVMDTDAVVAAMRSPAGASAALSRAVRASRVTLLATAPLCLEYEAVCARPEHVAAAGLGPGDLAVFLDALVGLVEPVEAWFLWRPRLRDPGDELVLEAAVNGRAAAVVTFNRRDFLPGASRFGVEVLSPADAIRRTRA